MQALFTKNLIHELKYNFGTTGKVNTALRLIPFFLSN